MQTIYPACFYLEKEGGYSVIFPDLNHLATCGDTIEEAVSMAIDCLAGYLYGEELDKNMVNAPSKLQDIDINAEYDDYAEAFVNLVAVDVDEYAKNHFNKAVKKTLTIPQWLNERAIAEGINFSAVLQNALKSELKLQ